MRAFWPGLAMSVSLKKPGTIAPGFLPLDEDPRFFRSRTRPITLGSGNRRLRGLIWFRRPGVIGSPNDIMDSTPQRSLFEI